MKFSSIKTEKNGAVRLFLLDSSKFFERIRTDANNFIISFLRTETTPEHPERYRRYSEVPHICATAELCRQENGALGMAAFNGLVVLEVRQVMSAEACEAIKRTAMEMPMTLAAFTGATGHEVIILVSVARADGSFPTTELEAEAFYPQAYHRVARIYDASLPQRVTRIQPTLRHTFLMPLDQSPRVNINAAPYHINEGAETTAADELEAHLLALPEQRSEQEMDMTTYQNYERSFAEAEKRIRPIMSQAPVRSNAWFKEYVTGMATALCEMRWPEEETVCHLWNHLKFKDVEGLTEEFVRRITEAVYTEAEANSSHAAAPHAPAEPLMQQLIRRMESRYCFRHNTVMGYTEYRSNHTWVTPWAPVTDKVINTFTTDLQLSGLNVWDRDVRRYVHSTRIRQFDPIDDYLFNISGQWDGRDHIRALARTVPTRNAGQWADWFHTWFLAMVAQWQGRDRRYGNAVVPLLISAQGMHKSAFCRMLLPPELRSWGYTDNLSLSEERPVHLAMAQMLLINLDEFNRISPQKQQGFLKNILQLPSVKVKRPYASHSEEVPRLASFIATTNMPDVLHDPTGSRRFLGIEVTGNIDVSQTPNYTQLYAQAQAELQANSRYWFDDKETAAIMQHNRQFQQLSTAEQFFHEFFEVVEPTDSGAQWMSSPALLMAIKQQAGATFKAPSMNAFGRTLSGIEGLHCKRNNTGRLFCVRPRF